MNTDTCIAITIITLAVLVLVGLRMILQAHHTCGNDNHRFEDIYDDRMPGVGIPMPPRTSTMYPDDVVEYLEAIKDHVYVQWVCSRCGKVIHRQQGG